MHPDARLSPVLFCKQWHEQLAQESSCCPLSAEGACCTEPQQRGSPGGSLEADRSRDSSGAGAAEQTPEAAGEGICGSVLFVLWLHPVAKAQAQLVPPVLSDIP